MSRPTKSVNLLSGAIKTPSTNQRASTTQSTAQCRCTVFI